MVPSLIPHPARVRAASLGAAVLMAACAATGPRPPGGSSAGDARWLSGTWKGGYHCALGYGDARLTLELEGRRGGRVDGVFAFEVTEPFTQIQPGSFRVKGSYGENGALMLSGTGWIDWPTGLKMVTLEGRADRKRDILSGGVPECGPDATFYLERLAEPE